MWYYLVVDGLLVTSPMTAASAKIWRSVVQKHCRSVRVIALTGVIRKN
jgi:hypothetical protein